MAKKQLNDKLKTYFFERNTAWDRDRRKSHIKHPQGVAPNRCIAHVWGVIAVPPRRGNS